MSSGLVVGRGFPIPWAHHDEVRHRRLLAEGINHTAEAAFFPETFVAQPDAPYVLTGSFAPTGLEVAVTPFLPARAHLLIFPALTGSSLVGEFRVTENGVAVGSVWAGGPYQILRPYLLPNTTYVYALEGRATSGSGSALETSSLSVRLEHRTLVP